MRTVLRLTLIIGGMVLLILSAIMGAARRPNPEPPFSLGTLSGPGGLYIYLQRQDNGEWIQLTPTGAEYRSPIWSPDGRWIAYTSYSLHRMRPDGRKVERLTQTLDGAPSWSPDGEYIIFQSYVEGNWDIYRLNLASGERLRLTDDPADDAAPVWSPNGDWIAFTSLRDGSWDVYRMRPDGSEELNLTNTYDNIFSPMWSPDGDYIGFFYNSISIKRITHIMRVDGTDWELLWDRDPAPDWELAMLPTFNLPWHGAIPAISGAILLLIGMMNYGRRDQADHKQVWPLIRESVV